MPEANRGFLGAPDNSIKFFPGIAEIASIKINKDKFCAGKHHVSHMIVSMLKALGPSLIAALGSFQDNLSAGPLLPL